jgi:hypothetical protein
VLAETLAAAEVAGTNLEAAGRALPDPGGLAAGDQE